MKRKKTPVIDRNKTITTREVCELFTCSRMEMKVVIVFVLCTTLPLKTVLNLQWRHFANNQIRVSNRGARKSNSAKVVHPLKTVLTGMLRGAPDDLVFPRYAGTLGFISAHADFLDTLNKARLKDRGWTLTSFSNFRATIAGRNKIPKG
jgi:hypothetical protein